MGPLGVIAGSGAHAILQGPFAEAKCLGPCNTPFGESAPVYQIEPQHAPEILVLPRHGEGGYSVAAPFVNYRANIYALKDLGAKRVLAWSGPGAIAEELEIGQYIVPDDCLDETRARSVTFYQGTGLGFIRQNPVFCPHLRRLLIDAAGTTGRKVKDGGVYACTEGPRLETPAEIRKLKLLGADLVGMTLVPEVFLARELAMCYAMICYVTNYAEGLRDRPYREGVLFEGLLSEAEAAAVDAAVADLAAVVIEVARKLANAGRTCPCPHSMDRYIRQGLITEDWRTWIPRLS